MTDKNVTAPRPTTSSNLKGNAPSSTGISSAITSGGSGRKPPSNSSSPPSSLSSSQTGNREDSKSDSVRYLLDRKPVAGVTTTPPYQYCHSHQKKQKSLSILDPFSASSDHCYNVTSDVDFDAKASSHLHYGKKHGRTFSPHQQQYPVSGSIQSMARGGSLTTEKDHLDPAASTSDVQEAIRNLLTSVDTASLTSSSTPPTRSEHHHSQASRSSMSSPTAASNTGGTPKVNHKKILPPSPIVVDSPSKTPRRKIDGVISLSAGTKSSPTYSCSPPVIPPHASSFPSPSSIGKYSATSGSTKSGSMKKDDIVLPPTRSTAYIGARTCQNTHAVTTITSSVINACDVISSQSGSADSKLYSPPPTQSPSKITSIDYDGSAHHHSKISKSTYKDKGKHSSVDRDSSSNVSNFYNTRQNPAEINDARPKYKSTTSNSSSSSSSSNKKKPGHHHSPNQSGHSGKCGGGVKNNNYNRGYRSLEKENTGDYMGYVTSYSNTIGSCGLGVDQPNARHKKDNTDTQQQHNQSTEGKPIRSSKDHVYYTADRPSRRNMPTTGGSSHRASSVPARRSMSVSEFAGTSVDPEPGNGQSDGENLEKVKSKLMSMWNNVKYGWTLNRKTSFRYDSPIFLLGEHYHRRHDDEIDGKRKDGQNCVNNMELFKLDFASRLWFTYRKDFEPLKGTKLTTDCGWGCMIRSGQMMLAQAFITHFFGRSWRIQKRDRGLNVYRQIIKWFADYQQCPFSVHQLVEIGSTLGRKPGEWYGPATVATMLREAMERSYEYQPVLRELCVYVASDCTVYLQEVADLCMSGNNNTLVKMPNGSDASVNAPSDTDESWKRAVIVLIPVRLGGESLNSVYIPCLQNLLAEEHCIGIIGGKPKHSLYFVGWQDKKLIYLDPHYCQDNVDVMSGDFTFSSFHCITPRKLPFEEMDPSCTIGFYCRNQEEFDKFVNQTRDLATNPKQKGLYPAFAFVDGRSCDLQMDKLELNKERYLRIRYVDQDGKQKLPANENDDFVVL